MLYRKSTFNNFLFENRAVYEIMWKKKIVQRDRRMRFVCWIHKATNTHSEYVTVITFSLQQWLQVLALMLRHPYIGCMCDITQNFKYILRLSPPKRALDFWDQEILCV